MIHTDKDNDGTASAVPTVGMPTSLTPGNVHSTIVATYVDVSNSQANSTRDEIILDMTTKTTKPVQRKSMDDVEDDDKYWFFRMLFGKGKNEDAEGMQEKDAPPVSISGLFKYSDCTDITLMIAGTICACGTGVLFPVFSLILGGLLDDFNGGDILAAGDKYSKIFAYLMAACFVCGFGQVAFFTIMSERMTLRIRKLYLASILRQEISWFDTSNPGELSSKIAENTVIIREGLGEKLGAGVQFAAMFLGGLIIALVNSWKLTLVVLAVSPLVAFGGFMMVKLMSEATSSSLGAYARAGAVAEEAFSLIRSVQSYSIERRTVARYTKELDRAELAGIRKSYAQGIGMGFTFGVYFLCYALAFWFGTKIVFDDQDSAAAQYPYDASRVDPVFQKYCQVGVSMSYREGTALGCQFSSYLDSFTLNNPADVCSCTVCNCGCNYSDGSGSCITGGDILACFWSIIIGSMSIGQAAPSLSSFTNARAAAGKIFQVIDREPEINSSGTSGAEVESSKLVGYYRFDDVTFRYPARREVIIFKSLNLDIEPNKTTALVGGSGCGKSTVTQLMMRFYDPEAGRVLLDGRDIREFNVASLRAQIGLVGQEPVLFATSVAQNIAQGAAPGVTVTRQMIEDAARAANAYDFIKDLPEGFDTFVGERGSSLSGGQKQRIAIARAIIRDPNTLILDEATSALDSKSERTVQRALDNLLKKRRRTTVVIAHRLSTVRTADKIVVLGANAGGVLEQGSHSELMKIDGMYSALVAAASRSQGHDDHHTDEIGIEEIMEQDEELQVRFGSHISSASNPEESWSPRGSTMSHKVSQRSPSAHYQERLASPIPSTASYKDVRDSENELEEEDESSNGGCFGKKKKKDKEDLYKVSTGRLFEYSKPDKLLYIPAILSALVSGAIMPVYGVIFSGIATVYFFPSQELVTEKSHTYIFCFIGLGIATAIGYWAQFSYFGIIGERMTTRIRAELFQTLLRQEIGFYDDRTNSIGGLTSKLASDASVVKASITNRLGLAVMNFVTIVAGTVISFFYCWQLTLVMMAMLPLVIVGGAMQTMIMSGLAKEDEKALSVASQVLTEAIYGVRTVTAFNLRTWIVDLYDEFLVGPSQLGVKKGISAGFGFGFSQAVTFSVYSVAFFYAARLIVYKGYSFVDVFTSIMVIFMVGFGMGQSAAMAPDLAKASVGINNVFRVLDRKSKIDPEDQSGLKEDSAVSDDITFDGVSFAYPSRPDALIYDNMTLHIKGGTTVALVGASGSGKSTCISLVERFYDASGGSVKIRGVETKEAYVPWLRQQIGYVQQEGQLFATTVFENIAYGIPAGPAANGRDIVVTQEMVEAAAKKSNAHDFIMQFPQGYETDVGPQGSQLSGGQRQRICLARCLMRRPKILLLDEATSALDNESQRIVQETLDTMINDLKATTLVVAHRLTTIQNADKIVVFSYGVPVEQGTHKELLAKNDGAYAALWSAQEGSEHA